MVNVCFLSGDMSRTGGTERVLSIIANELSKKDDKFNIHILSITNESNSSYFALNKNIKTEMNYLYRNGTADWLCYFC